MRGDAGPVPSLDRVPSFGQRARAAALSGGVALLRRVPDRAVYRSAYLLGCGLSLLLHDRRRLVTSNLRQATNGLVAAGLASRRVRSAAVDERALARLVRAAFGHWAVSYAESAITPGYSVDRLRKSVRTPNTEVARAAIAPPEPGTPGRIFVSPHFGSLELAGLYAVSLAGLRLVAPMETVADPALQAYFERARGATGIEIVPIRGASNVLRGALADGAAVALVADRAIGGIGLPVDLLGAPARLPLGPAILALESGAPVYVVGTRRTGWGEWAISVERLDQSPPDSLRVRLRAQLEAQARAFERIIASAPEQWWGCFFPIWKETHGPR